MWVVELSRIDQPSVARQALLGAAAMRAGSRTYCTWKRSLIASDEEELFHLRLRKGSKKEQGAEEARVAAFA